MARQYRIRPTYLQVLELDEDLQDKKSAVQAIQEHAAMIAALEAQSRHAASL